MTSPALYRTSAPVFARFLRALSGILAKAERFAAQSGTDPQSVLTLQLRPGMYNLHQQVAQAVFYAVSGAARPAGAARPDWAAPELSFAGLQTRIAEGVAFIEGLEPARYAGREQETVTIPFDNGERSFTAEDYLHGFALPGFYFHLSMAYAILRQFGVALGKADFMGEAEPG